MKGIVHNKARTAKFMSGLSDEMTKILQDTIDALSQGQSDKFYAVLYKKLSIMD